MKVQRILEITRHGVCERVEVSSSIELFSLLLDPEVTQAEMVWDAVLGEERMTFKSQRRRGQRRPQQETSKAPVLVATERRPRIESGDKSYYDIRIERQLAVSEKELSPGRFARQDACPDRGQRLRDFQLPAVSGGQVHLSEYWGRFNLILVFAAECAGAVVGLLSEIAHRYPKCVEEQAQVLVIFAGTKTEAEERLAPMQLPFPVLVDVDGSVHRTVCAVEPDGGPSPAVYVTDRYGEIFAVFPTPGRRTSPNVNDLLEWLEFINIQCPECFPPECRPRRGGGP